MRRISLLAALALLLPQLAMGWGRVGHRTIAEIAERNLTPKAKANIERYTGGAPLHTLSLWMDEVRNDEPYKTATEGWHASIADSDNTSPQVVRNRYRDGKDGVTAMYDFRNQLKDYRNMPDSAVLVALKCMIHIVGDFHCPSHLRYVDAENKGRFAVKLNGKITDMHKAWDTGIITTYHKGWKQKEYADHLNTLTKKEIKKITKGWAQEWFEDAAVQCRPVIYWTDDRKVETIDEAKMAKMGPLGELQMQRAGYRLAKALNEIFK
ncbi:MAG: S1/P1 nuclease [Alistipes sp.]|nr:S1/P1 nuclease [Alistipes sp.]